MKLQIKDAGAWRNVASFTKGQEESVLQAAAALLQTLDSKTAMRVVEGEVTRASCTAPDYLWKRNE